MFVFQEKIARNRTIARPSRAGTVPSAYRSVIRMSASARRVLRGRRAKMIETSAELNHANTASATTPMEVTRKSFLYLKSVRL